MIDSLVALMLVGILGAVVYNWRSEEQLEKDVVLTEAEVHRLAAQIELQAALENVELTQRGYPRLVKPEWFHGNLPLNPLLESGHPWLEIASASQHELRHPPNPIAAGADVAQFWYNPYTGDVRARVPTGVSDAKALELYNRVNEASLKSLMPVR